MNIARFWQVIKILDEVISEEEYEKLVKVLVGILPLINHLKF